MAKFSSKAERYVEMHQSPMDSPHKDQNILELYVSFLLVWTIC